MRSPSPNVAARLYLQSQLRLLQALQRIYRYCQWINPEDSSTLVKASAGKYAPLLVQVQENRRALEATSLHQSCKPLCETTLAS